MNVGIPIPHIFDALLQRPSSLIFPQRHLERLELWLAQKQQVASSQRYAGSPNPILIGVMVAALVTKFSLTPSKERRASKS